MSLDAVEQAGRANLQGMGEPNDGREPWVAQASLDARYLGGMNARAATDLRLAELPLRSGSGHIAGEGSDLAHLKTACRRRDSIP